MTEDPLKSSHCPGFHTRERARDERAASGGLRSPHLGIQGRNDALAVGREIFSVIVATCDLARHNLSSLGADELPPQLEEAVRSTRAALAAGYSARLSPAGVQGDLIRALVERAKDPDTDVPTWLMGATPIGILRPITPPGISPLHLAFSLRQLGWAHRHICPEDTRRWVRRHNLVLILIQKFQIQLLCHWCQRRWWCHLVQKFS